MLSESADENTQSLQCTSLMASQPFSPSVGRLSRVRRASWHLNKTTNSIASRGWDYMGSSCWVMPSPLPTILSSYAAAVRRFQFPSASQRLCGRLHFTPYRPPTQLFVLLYQLLVDSLDRVRHNTVRYLLHGLWLVDIGDCQTDRLQLQLDGHRGIASNKGISLSSKFSSHPKLSCRILLIWTSI